MIPSSIASARLIHSNYWGNKHNIHTPQSKTTFIPPKLPYSYDGLRPLYTPDGLKNHFLHYHMRSFEEFYDLINNTPAEGLKIEKLFQRMDDFSEELQYAAGSWYNHQFFWDNLSPCGGMIGVELENAITASFGGVYQLKTKLLKTSLRHKGCGWAWLVLDKDGSMEIVTTKGNINPLMNTCTIQGTPLLNIDLWEHAYFQKFNNNKNGYLKSIWNLINWSEVSYRYLKATTNLKI